MTTWLERRLARRAGKAGLETERLLLDLTESFVQKMVTKNVKRTELARRMGVDRAVITRVMAGDRNVTLRTLVSVASGLGCRLKMEVEDDAAAEAHIDVASQQSVTSASVPLSEGVQSRSAAYTVALPVYEPLQLWDSAMRASDGGTMAIEWKAFDFTSLIGSAQPVPQDPALQLGDDDGIKAAA